MKFFSLANFYRGRRHGSRLSPPCFLFLDVNQRCNLRCQHCIYWKQTVPSGFVPLSEQRRREIIGEFAGMNPRGAVVICGGESLLDPKDYFAVTRQCLAEGLRCLSVINGTCVRDAGMADLLIGEGPSEITVSLDDHRPDRHDEYRGVKGSFALAVNAVRLLREARERNPSRGTRLYVMGLIHEGNYRELDAFYDFVLNELRADKLKLNFLQPTFGLEGGADEFFARYYIRDPESLLAILKACDEKYRLRFNPAWLRTVEIYARSINEDSARRGWANAEATAEPICNSYERNIMVDLEGNARLCFARSFPHVPLRRPGDLRRFWYEESGPIRQKMKHCRRPCGISHSVRREPATLPGAAL